jgi:thiol:disulfide interchange protein
VDGTLRRKLMAFPMFATVAWLVWVLGQQSGIDGAGALLALLVCLSLLVWTLTLRGRTRMVIATVRSLHAGRADRRHRANMLTHRGAGQAAAAPNSAGSRGRRPRVEQLWAPASRCSSTSPPPGA